MINKTELILPGGDLERVKIAFLYGADAVYIGLNQYSLRKTEVRFDFKEVKEAIDLAHKQAKRLFVTFNIFAHNSQLDQLQTDLSRIAEYGPDAFIISDPGLINLAQRVAPKIPIHLSTQANTVNLEAIKFWQKQGLKRIVLGRELSLIEIKEIHKSVPDMELEMFVHGAMCISYSGRCLLSSYMTGRKANLGDCAQPCRWHYNVFLEEKMRPGELYPIEESEEGTTIMSSKDLRLIRYIPEVLEAGVTGLKVEGRNKSEYYLATTGHAYREALTLIENNSYQEKEKNRLEKELEKLSYRGYTTGFAFNEAKLGEISAGRHQNKAWAYLGIVVAKNNLIAVKNKIKLNDKIEVLTPDGNHQDKIINITNLENQNLPEINPGTINQKVFVELLNKYPINSILRKKL